MINYIYQLISPRQFAVKFSDISYSDQGVLVRPTHMAICHADQRYYTGLRNETVLHQKLPMALIHECVALVVHDQMGKFEKGETVMLIPNIPAGDDLIIAENYRKGSFFRSSGFDGFMQEHIIMPHNRLVKYENVIPEVAAIGEFISVGVHAINTFIKKSHSRKECIGVWGDGALGFTIAFLLKHFFPESNIVVIGKNPSKLVYFTFAQEVCLVSKVGKDLNVDHAFECTGNEGCELAIEQMISHINPEGTIMLLGVSEVKVPILTRMVVEKGLTFVGRSRSGREDFENVATLLKNDLIQRRFRTLISNIVTIRSINDIHVAFESDINTPFKTVMNWEM
jgi:ribitol-5-phosphate 2-dehydrogenase